MPTQPILLIQKMIVKNLRKILKMISLTCLWRWSALKEDLHLGEQKRNLYWDWFHVMCTRQGKESWWSLHNWQRDWKWKWNRQRPQLLPEMWWMFPRRKGKPRDLPMLHQLLGRKTLKDKFVPFSVINCSWKC